MKQKDDKVAIVGAGAVGLAAFAAGFAKEHGVVYDDKVTVEDVKKIMRREAKPLIIPSKFKSRGRGTNMTPPKKKRK